MKPTLYGMLNRSVIKVLCLKRCLSAPRTGIICQFYSQRAWGAKRQIAEKEPFVREARFYNQPRARMVPMEQAVLTQTTSRVMMVEPTCFNYNPQTAKDNAFQRKMTGLTNEDAHRRAMREFNDFTVKLAQVGVEVNRERDTMQSSEDAVFPNNWISFHEETDRRRRIVLYPMKSERRRLERRNDLVSEWKHRLGAEVVDYTKFENQGKFLEGTGSMVLDRVNRVAYACESQRTDADLFYLFCQNFGYSPILFKSYSRDEFGKLTPIYHTNVMMSIGSTLAIICLESIVVASHKEKVQTRLREDSKVVVPITLDQVNHFAGNVLELKSCEGNSYLVMSSRAYNSFTSDQKAVMSEHVDGIIHSSLETIETLGGGGARCMIAEVFPPNDG